jgi:2-dehydropantoate 2-reductase
LDCGKKDITLLARGAWKETIDRDGLCIRHYIQCRTTVDRIKTIESLATDDCYDLIIVVMQYTQLTAVLPILAANSSKNIMLVGNNANSVDTCRTLQEVSYPKKQIALGFQATGGRRENNRVISIHPGFGIKLGGLHDALTIEYKKLLHEVFHQAKCKLTFFDNMDAYYKCHLAFILPVCFACYACDGNLKKADTKLLNQVVDAVNEGYSLLETLGYPFVPPGEARFFRNKRSQFYLVLWVVAKTALGRLAASDHAMNARGEMAALNNAFDKLKVQANLPMPHWDALETYLH